MTSGKGSSQSTVFTGRVVANRQLCQDHLRLTLLVSSFPDAMPGQFVHIGPHVADEAGEGQRRSAGTDDASAPVPFLRRAFSIGGLRRSADDSSIELIYRVLGAGTGWMSRLREGDLVDGIGPLGNGFEAPPENAAAWLVAGGVGLPPLLWFAQQLSGNGQRVVFFLGARSANLIALVITPRGETTTARELPGLPVVLATDDGSIGLHGTVVDALEAYARAHEPSSDGVVVYTCGPEVMMRSIAGFCRGRGIGCQACMERAMACGIGTCQSCVVPVTDASDADGWRYALCCSEGPVFDARDVLWDQ